MSETGKSTPKTQAKVGIFAIAGLLLIGAVTVYVNDKPYWWRSCQLVHINVEDATGLKAKSPIRSLGLEIGYLKTIELSETHVSLGICITANVEVLPSTRAYIRSEGFLGDKFVELKPMKYVGSPREVSWLDSLPSLVASARAEEAPGTPPADPAAGAPAVSPADAAAAAAVPSPAAAPTKPGRKIQPRQSRGNTEGREIPVGEANQDMQQVVGRVDSLVQEMTNLTTNLKTAINPEELRQTMRQLNRTLENASKTLSPEGGLNQTAQRTLGKLEDAVEQLRDQMTRINQGKGSLGMLLNDPAYADEIRDTLRNANKLLTKVGHVRFVVDIGGAEINGYEGGRGWFRLGIWPSPDRYYLIGVSVDPRGRRTSESIETTLSDGSKTRVNVDRVETTGILITGMVGKVFWKRLDLSLGAFQGDGTVSAIFNLGPNELEDRIQLRNDLYTHSGTSGVDYRGSVTLRPYWSLYLTAGIESLHKVGTETPVFYGAGVSFDDEDIKLLFALR